MVIRTSDPNKVVVLEVSENKNNVEIVGWRYAGERQLEELKRQAEREDGQLLILTPDTRAAAGLSTLPHDLSSEGKDSENIIDIQENGGENEGKQSIGENAGEGSGVEGVEKSQRFIDYESQQESVGELGDLEKNDTAEQFNGTDNSRASDSRASDEREDNRLSEAQGAEEEGDIRFALAEDEGSAGSGTAGNPTPEGEGGGSSEEGSRREERVTDRNGSGSDGSDGGRQSGPRFLDNILDTVRQNVERARQAREQARQAHRTQRGKRDQAVREMFGRGGIMNDESIPPAARQHLAADIVKGLGDIRDVLKSNTLQTEEKVRAITDTLIPMMMITLYYF